LAQLAVLVERHLQQRCERAVDGIPRRLELHTGEVLVDRPEGLEIDGVVAGSRDVRRDARPVRYHEVVAAGTPDRRANPRALSHADGRPSQPHRRVVELIGDAANVH
jgi:hypothetical protein